MSPARYPLRHVAVETISATNLIWCMVLSHYIANLDAACDRLKFG